MKNDENGSNRKKEGIIEEISEIKFYQLIYIRNKIKEIITHESSGNKKKPIALALKIIMERNRIDYEEYINMISSNCGISGAAATIV